MEPLEEAGVAVPFRAINIVNQDPECCINVCKDKPQQMEIRAAVKNNFGFGGTNATLVFKRV